MRFGVVFLIVVFVVVGLVVMVVYMFISSFVVWFMFSLLYGIIGGVLWVVSEIWMNVVVEEKCCGRVMGFYVMLVVLGFALGLFVL